MPCCPKPMPARRPLARTSVALPITLIASFLPFKGAEDHYTKTWDIASDGLCPLRSRALNDIPELDCTCTNRELSIVALGQKRTDPGKILQEPNGP